MDDEIKVEAEIAAPPARAFEAWTNPEQVKAWWNVPDEFRTVAFASDLRVGGPWQATFQTKDGTKFSTGGAYLKIAAPSHLGFTWKASWDNCAPSLADLEFVASPTGTTVKVRHSRFQSAEEAQANREAWVSALGLLKTYLERTA